MPLDSDSPEHADRAALVGELFDRHYTSLYRTALRLVRNVAAAEDLTQETFLRVAKGRHKVPQDAEQARAWLLRILINLSHDRFRKHETRRRYLAQTFVARSLPPGDAIAWSLAVNEALMSLSARRRAIVVLCELEGYSSVEVARMLRLRAGTVRWHLARAREQLARQLGVSADEERE